MRQAVPARRDEANGYTRSLTAATTALTAKINAARRPNTFGAGPIITEETGPSIQSEEGFRAPCAGSQLWQTAPQTISMITSPVAIRMNTKTTTAKTKLRW